MKYLSLILLLTACAPKEHEQVEEYTYPPLVIRSTECTPGSVPKHLTLEYLPCDQDTDICIHVDSSLGEQPRAVIEGNSLTVSHCDRRVIREALALMTCGQSELHP